MPFYIPFKVGDTVTATVFATEPYGIYFDYMGFNILIKITECPWAMKKTTSEFTQVGVKHQVKILYLKRGARPKETTVLGGWA